MKKRILSLLAGILAAFLLPLSSVAEQGTAKLSADPKEAQLNETVAISVSVSSGAASGEALNTLHAVVTYDPNALSYGGFELKNEETRTTSVASDAVWGVRETKAGTIEFAFANAYGCEDGFLLTLLFQSKKDGVYTISLQEGEYSLYRASDKTVRSLTMEPATIATITIGTAIPTPMPTDTPSPTPQPTETPQPTDTPKPTDTPSPTPKATKKPTPTPKEDEEEEDPTPKPTKKPTATPTATPTPTPTPTTAPTATPAPTAEPTAVPTATPTPAPTQRALHPITDGEGGCSSCNNSTLGILILDIGIAFLAIQMIIVVLIIYRKRRKRTENDFSEEASPDPDDPGDSYEDIEEPESDEQDADDDIPNLFQ